MVSAKVSAQFEKRRKEMLYGHYAYEKYTDHIQQGRYHEVSQDNLVAEARTSGSAHEAGRLYGAKRNLSLRSLGFLGFSANKG
jgi:hypothetical protein